MLSVQKVSGKDVVVSWTKNFFPETMLTDFCKKPVDVGDDNSLGQLPAGPNFCQIAIPISTIITHSDWIEC